MHKIRYVLVNEKLLKAPSTAPIVFPTFGKLNSVRTPSPPTAGPHEKGPAVKSINAHLRHSFNINHSVCLIKVCKHLCVIYEEREREKPVISNP